MIPAKAITGRLLDRSPRGVVVPRVDGTYYLINQLHTCALELYSK